MNRPPALPPLDLVNAFAQAQIDARVPAHQIIATMVADYGARCTSTAVTNALICAGVRATCTWSENEYLLAAWLRAARKRLGEMRAPPSPFITDAEVPY